MLVLVVVGVVAGVVIMSAAFNEGRFEGAMSRLPASFAEPVPREKVEEWLRTWYEAAHSDIQWAKNRGWKVMQSSLVLIAGIVAAANNRPFTDPALHEIRAWLFRSLLLLCWCGTAYYLWDLHCFQRDARTIASRILNTVPESEAMLERGRARARDRHHLKYLAAKLLIVLGACIVGWLGLPE